MENTANVAPTPPQAPNLEPLPKSSIAPYIIGVVVAIVIVAGIAYFFTSSKTTIYKGSIPYKGLFIRTQADLLRASTLNIDVSAELDSQIADLKKQRQGTTDPTTQKILDAQIASLQSQLDETLAGSQKKGTAGNSSLTKDQAERNFVAEEVTIETLDPPLTDEELLKKYEELKERFAEMLYQTSDKSAKDLVQLLVDYYDLRILYLQKIIMQTTGVGAPSDIEEQMKSVDSQLKVVEELPELSALLTQIEQEVDRVQQAQALSEEQIAASKTLVPEIEEPLESDVKQSAPAPTVVTQSPARNTVAQTNVAATVSTEPLPKKASQVGSPAIQGKTGPGLIVYAIFGAPLLAHLARRRRKAGSM